MNEFYLDGMPKILFGRQKFESIGQILSEYGYSDYKFLILTGGKFVKSIGFLEKLLIQLKTANISYEIYSDISSNPKSQEIDDIVRYFKEKSCDAVIGFGGGSIMDAAKAVAAVAKCGGRCWEYVRCWDDYEPDVIKSAYPVITIPTRFGSGAEVTPFAVISNLATKEKAVMTSSFIMPSLAFIDPCFASYLNATDFSYAVCDAASHILETYLSGENSSVVADSISETLLVNLFTSALNYNKIYAAADLKRENQPADEQELKNIIYDDVFYVSMLALTGIAQAGRGGDFIMHDLEHPLSAHFNLHHGAGLSVLIPAVMEFFCEAAASRYSRLYKNVFKRLIDSGFDFFPHAVAGADEEETAKLAVDSMRVLLEKIGVGAKLSIDGLTSELIEKMADDVIRLYGHGKMYLDGPKKLRYSDITEIYSNIIKM